MKHYDYNAIKEQILEGVDTYLDFEIAVCREWNNAQFEGKNNINCYLWDSEMVNECFDDPMEVYYASKVIDLPSGSNDSDVICRNMDVIGHLQNTYLEKDGNNQNILYTINSIFDDNSPIQWEKFIDYLIINDKLDEWDISYKEHQLKETKKQTFSNK